MSVCEDPRHDPERTGRCTRWDHLPGSGRGPHRPILKRRMRAAVMRAARHVIIFGLIGLACLVAVKVIGPRVAGFGSAVDGSKGGIFGGPATSTAPPTGGHK